MESFVMMDILDADPIGVLGTLGHIEYGAGHGKGCKVQVTDILSTSRTVTWCVHMGSHTCRHAQ